MEPSLQPQLYLKIPQGTGQWSLNIPRELVPGALPSESRVLKSFIEVAGYLHRAYILSHKVIHLHITQNTQLLHRVSVTIAVQRHPDQDKSYVKGNF